MEETTYITSDIAIESTIRTLKSVVHAAVWLDSVRCHHLSCLVMRPASVSRGLENVVALWAPLHGCVWALRSFVCEHLLFIGRSAFSCLDITVGPAQY